ncbi:OmpA family protein [Dankookia sp. P2]|uniref:OmpA family protein n=1 Tax=Dankookia sp. P2 TaxID=3423955 RepID=UPI003D666C46
MPKPTFISCGRAARASRPLAAAALLALGLAGCAAPQPPPPPAPAPVAAAPSPPRQAQDLDAAVDSSTTAVLARAELPPAAAGQRRSIVIDPLIDRATGAETRTTRAMARRIAAKLQGEAGFDLRPFTQASLEAKPLVLLGAISGVTASGSLKDSTEEPGAYRIWAVLADLGSGKVVAHETAWVRTDAVDATPTEFHQDSPVWLPDRATAAYLKVCAAPTGAPIDADWQRGLRASTLLAQATAAYEAGQPARALSLYQAADKAQPAGRLQGLNGEYLAANALGREEEAEQAFGKLVDYGLAERNLGVKFLFAVGQTRFWPDKAISGPYPMWLRQIANRTAADNACLDVVGHASPTGPDALNDRLSLARAQRIKADLVAEQGALRQRTATEGRGAREPIVGNKRDDATDAVDRRVAFLPQSCRAMATR